MTINLTELKQLTSSFKENNKDVFIKIKEESERLYDVCLKIDVSWSGSPFGHHAYHYYNRFLPPPSNERWSIEWGTVNGVPQGWNYLQGDQVKDEIESQMGSGFTIRKYSKEYEELLDRTISFKDDVLMELSEKNNLGEETFESIKNFDLGDIDALRAECINSNRVMGSFMSRDSEALSGGRIIPSHITTLAGVYAARNILEKIKSFSNLVEKIIKQISKKSDMPEESVSSRGVEYRLEHILNKFHIVSRQLLDRHDSRSTIEIKDEHDVQDLLHALLSVDFEDIRPEEWTPSYAGSSTRVDFLLKQEKIIIEVKIARKRLKDKDIGEQLILDIAHYKTHPDCKQLYCFVYDPELVLLKKVQLVSDLQGVHNGLDVKIFIRPFN